MNADDLLPDQPDPDDASPVRERSRMSKALCDAINDHFDGSPTDTAREFGVSVSTVERHVAAIDYRGDCKQHGGVDAYLCTKLREQYADGVGKADLGKEHDLDPRTVLYHVRGECGHD